MRNLRLGLLLIMLAGGWWHCQSGMSSWKRLQSDFVGAFPEGSEFLVVDSKDTLRLPLPPPPLADENAAATLLSSFYLRAKALDSTQLSQHEFERLKRFRLALLQLQLDVQQETYARCNPEDYAMAGLLQHFLDDEGEVRHPALLVQLLESVPDYYRSVRENWQAPATDHINLALMEMLQTMESLEQIAHGADALSIGYRERIKKAVPRARTALKEYISLCQSAWLQ
ncbi:MAG: hypothetical protein IPL65_05875 [Lewinellaceae bacterium]|nr:hypothetical protein [Lewinellaceae bacterium]